MSIKFEFLPVDGDAILITTEDFVMLIDGGRKSTYPRLKTRLEQLDRPIDLIILTHIDGDHIFGLIKLFEDIKNNKTNIKVKKIWFNSLVDRKLTIDTSHNNTDSPEISKRQAENLSQLLKDLSNSDIEHINNDICCDKPPYDKIFSLSKTIKIRLLSPTKNSLTEMYKTWDPKLFAKQNMAISPKNDYHLKVKRLMNAKFENDDSEFNASSIAFILFYGSHQFLMLADANILIVIDQLLIALQQDIAIKNNFTFVKVSHHGSARNTNDDFLDMIQCSHFIFCALGNNLPSKEVISRIIKNAIKKQSKNNIYQNKSRRVQLFSKP